MNWIAIWMTARLARWGLWLGFLAYALYVHLNRANIFTKLNQLPLHVELLLNGLALGAIFMGFFELLVRERSGLSRPPYFGMPKEFSKES